LTKRADPIVLQYSTACIPFLKGVAETLEQKVMNVTKSHDVRMKRPVHIVAEKEGRMIGLGETKNVQREGKRLEKPFRRMIKADVGKGV